MSEFIKGIYYITYHMVRVYFACSLNGAIYINQLHYDMVDMTADMSKYRLLMTHEHV